MSASVTRSVCAITSVDQNSPTGISTADRLGNTPRRFTTRPEPVLWHGLRRSKACRPTRVSRTPRLEKRFGGDNRPIFLNRPNVKSLDVAQVGDTLYYFSAGFLTFKQSEFTSCLSADRPLLRLECRVAARVSLVAASDTWNPSWRCRGANENWHSRSIAEYRADENIA